MKLRTMITCPLLGVLAACTCSGGDAPDADTIARVNGQAISTKVFAAEVQRNLDRHRDQGHPVDANVEYGVQLTVLERMIDSAIVDTRVKELVLDPENRSLDARFAEYRGRFPSQDDFDEYLERTNNTIDMIRASLRRDILIESVGGSFEPKPEEVRAYYDANKASYLQGDETRPFVDVKKDIEHLLRSRTRDAKTRSILQELKSAAKIERLVTLAPPEAAPAPPPEAAPDAP